MSDAIRIRTTPNGSDKYLKVKITKQNKWLNDLHVCPFCSSNSIIKAGKYYWVDKNNIKKSNQHFRCLDCKKRFNLNTNKETSFNRDIELYNLIITEYVNNNLLISKIAIKLNISITTVRRVLKKYNIKKRDKIEEIIRGITGLEYNDYINNLKKVKEYKKIVNYLTSKQPIETLPNFEKRGPCGVLGAYQLDHKYSISEGFKNKIDPLIISNINNLEFIPWEENTSKKNKCSITIDELKNFK